VPSRFRSFFLIERIIEDRFPKLRNTHWLIKSPWNDTYQCFAWAICRTDLLWWPQEIYWPPNSAANDDVEAFVLALSELGYVRCGSPDYEFGYQKIAIYASSDRSVLHMARQKFWGRGWLSKLGDWEDIAHADLRCIEGDPSPIAVALGSYGQVEEILKRSWWSALVNLCIFRCLWGAIRFWIYRLRHPSWIWSNVVRSHRRQSTTP
jgi:hypothetical protein